jgi:hypothetical protein
MPGRSIPERDWRHFFGLFFVSSLFLNSGGCLKNRFHA